MRREREIAYKNRANFKARVTGLSTNSGAYTVETQGGSIYRGVSASDTWSVDDWVTVTRTDRGYIIIGYAASGPTDYIAPGS